MSEVIMYSYETEQERFPILVLAELSSSRWAKRLFEALLCFKSIVSGINYLMLPEVK